MVFRALALAFDPCVELDPWSSSLLSSPLPLTSPSNCILGIWFPELEPEPEAPLEVVLIKDLDRMLLPPTDRILFEDDVAMFIMADDRVEVVKPCKGWVLILWPGLWTESWASWPWVSTLKMAVSSKLKVQDKIG